MEKRELMRKRDFAGHDIMKRFFLVTSTKGKENETKKN